MLLEILKINTGHPDIEGKHIFSVAADGNYSAKAAYEGLFSGSTSFAHYQRVWKTCPPPKMLFLPLARSLPIGDAGLLTDRPKEVWTTLPDASSVTKKLRPWIISWWPVCLQGISGFIFCGNLASRIWRHSLDAYPLWAGGRTKLKPWTALLWRASTIWLPWELGLFRIIETVVFLTAALLIYLWFWVQLGRKDWDGWWLGPKAFPFLLPGTLQSSFSPRFSCCEDDVHRFLMSPFMFLCFVLRKEALVTGLFFWPHNLSSFLI